MTAATNRFGFGFFNRIFPLTCLLFLETAVKCVALGERGLYFDYIETTSKVLRLRCHVNTSKGFGSVISITILNMTSQAKNVTSETKMAWVGANYHPTLAKKHKDDRNVFLSGTVSSNMTHPSLHLIFLHFESSIDQKFCCLAKILKPNTDVEILSWVVTVNKTVAPKPEIRTSSTTTTTTGAPYRIGAVKNDEKIKPFLDSEGLPMTVLIIMLVIVSILLFLAVFLLMHRYRSRCQRRDPEDMYRPPAYCLAPDHHMDWTDNSSSLKSKGSGRTLNSRGHYSFAAHQHMPLPPIPHMTPRRNKTYRRPPSTNSSVRVQYIQPQDAIGQESSEDGEIAALSSGSPNVHYKTSRDRLSRQNSPLYACVPVSSTDE